jgi:Tfp pilus assembly protein FimT
MKYGRSGVTLIELLVVMASVAAIVAISFPALSTGLGAVRLVSAAGSTASFLTAAMNDVERHEQPAAITIDPKQNELAVRNEHLKMPQGISIEGDEARRIALFPGGAFPRIRVVLRNQSGGRRSVEIDPITAVPKIERVADDR